MNELPMPDVRREMRETGLTYTVATLAPVLLSLILLLALVGVPQEQYAGADWYKYCNFLLPQICFAAAALVYFRRGTRTVREVYAPCKARYFLLSVLLQFGLLFSLSELNGLFVALLGKIGYETNIDDMLPSLSGWGLLPAMLVIALLPALFEETIFRGILTGGMRASGWGTAATVLISGAMFSLFHHNPAQTVYQFLCGACFALVVLRAGSPFPTMIAHFCNNAAVLAFTAAGVDSFYSALPLGGYIALVVCAGLTLAAVLVYLIFFDKNNRAKGGVKEGATFFFAAGAGIVLCAVEWIAMLAEGIL